MMSVAARGELIERLIRSVVESPDTPEAYRDAARHTGALPVHCDMGGCLAITPQGEIVEFDPETELVRPVRDEKWRRIALAKAARRYEALQELQPAKPVGAVPCAPCNGRGVIVGDLDCGECAGLGWTP